MTQEYKTEHGQHTVDEMAFFSFVIPAHNEEGYIQDTLSSIQRLEYPKDKIEVIIVENGSTDKTYEVAQRFASDKVRIFQTEPGVSIAKNEGLRRVSDRSDWIVIADADTKFSPQFLNDLHACVQRQDLKKEGEELAIGTTSMLPYGDTEVGWYGRAWFHFYNAIHKITHTSFGIQILNAHLKNKVRFDEQMKVAEDFHFIRNAVQYGSFFYVQTKTVSTSVRRFEQVGWIKLGLYWLWSGIKQFVLKGKKMEYPIVR